MLFEAFLGQGYKSCLFSTSGGRRERRRWGGGGKEGKKKKRREQKKMSAIFSFTVAESVTFFDISTEGLVLQQRLPDALIDSPVSNRKRNKCFIELELSLVIAVGKGWRLGWVGVGWVVVGKAEFGGGSQLLCGCQFSVGGLHSILSISTLWGCGVNN